MTISINRDCVASGCLTQEMKWTKGLQSTTVLTHIRDALPWSKGTLRGTEETLATILLSYQFILKYMLADSGIIISILDWTIYNSIYIYMNWYKKSWLPQHRNFPTTRYIIWQNPYITEITRSTFTPKYPRLPKSIYGQHVETVKQSGPWNNIGI